MITKNGRIVDDEYNSQNYPRLYHIWSGAKYRCRNPKASNYQHYGAKGIDLCKEWNKFAPFCKWALENGYAENLTLDRIDNSKGYSSDNCITEASCEECEFYDRLYVLAQKNFSVDRDLKEIGKTVFLTKAEAEEKLRELEGK